MKALQILATGKAMRGHKLLTLFKGLPEGTQSAVQARYRERLGRDSVTFLQDLATFSDAFNEWRYIFEQSGAEIEFGFLQHLVASLYEVTIQLESTWKHPNDERLRSTPGPFDFD
jgi:hypothetical protein